MGTMALYTEARIKPPPNTHLVYNYYKYISSRHIRQNQKTKAYGHLFKIKCHSNIISITLIDNLYNMFH
jgi:hypothetical protein